MKRNFIAQKDRKRRGVAVPLALLSLVIVLAMGVGLLRVGLDNRLLAVRTSNKVLARAAADAGLIEALHLMNDLLSRQDLTSENLPSATNNPLPGAEATFTYTVTDGDNGYVIVSTGYSGAAQWTVTASLKVVGPYEFALFADESIELKAAATVDWHGEPGDYNLKIGTNNTEFAAITLKNDSLINGDVIVGMGGDPETVISGNGSTITGETAALLSYQDLSSVNVPEWVESLPLAEAITDETTITESGRYAGINLGNDKTITIEDNVTLYVTGDIILAQGTALKVSNTNASLTLYAGSDIEAKNSTGLNNLTEDAGKLQILGLDSCESIDLKNSTNLYAAIYAPRASIDLKNSADVCGSIVCRSYIQRNSATFRYPASLRDATMSDPVVKLEIDKWRE